MKLEKEMTPVLRGVKDQEEELGLRWIYVRHRGAGVRSWRRNYGKSPVGSVGLRSQLRLRSWLELLAELE